MCSVRMSISVFAEKMKKRDIWGCTKETITYQGRGGNKLDECCLCVNERGFSRRLECEEEC